MKMQTNYINHPTTLADIAQSIAVFEKMHGFWSAVPRQYDADVRIAGHIRHSDLFRQVTPREPVQEGCTVIDTEEGPLDLRIWCMVFRLQLWDAYVTYTTWAGAQTEPLLGAHYAQIAHNLITWRLECERAEAREEVHKRDRLIFELTGKSFWELERAKTEEATQAADLRQLAQTGVWTNPDSALAR